MRNIIFHVYETLELKMGHVVLNKMLMYIMFQAHQDGVRSEFTELVKQFKELTFPTAPPKFLLPFDPTATV